MIGYPQMWINITRITPAFPCGPTGVAFSLAETESEACKRTCGNHVLSNLRMKRPGASMRLSRNQGSGSPRWED